MVYHFVLMGEEYFSLMGRSNALRSRLLMRSINKCSTLEIFHVTLAVVQRSV